MSEQAGDEWRLDGATAGEIAVPPAGTPSALRAGLNALLRHASPAALRRGAARAARQALEMIYPPSCIACRRATMQAGTLCASCWAKMPFIERPYCERLGTPFAQDLGDGLISPEAFANPPVFRRARAVARFEDGPARDLVHNLKYGDRLELAEPMGAWMARAGADLLGEADLVVPVPLHRQRLFSRRFNQAAVLAQEIAGRAQKPFDPLALTRARATPPQVGLTRAQRAQNVQGAFRVAAEARIRVHGKRILLVDDVLTSGATVNAAARILMRAGATQIDVLVFARVVTAA